MKPLFVPLKKTHFQSFASGAKKEEFRPYGPRWNEQTCQIGRKVVLSLGYGRFDRMLGTITGFRRSTAPSASQEWKDCYGERDAEVACIQIEIDHGHPIASGRILVVKGGFLVVEQEKGEFLKGYPLSPLLAVGSGHLLDTPAGWVHMIATPERCRLVRILWDGKLKPGEPGSPAGIMHTLAAAKLDSKELDRMLVETVGQQDG